MDYQFMPYSKDYYKWCERTPDKTDFTGNLAHVLLLENDNLNIHIAYAIAESLFGRMSNPFLYYHSPLHILAMLDWAQNHGIQLEPWQHLSIWFHDAIYQVGTYETENECDSADFAAALLGRHFDSELNSKIRKGIISTAYHSSSVEVLNNFLNNCKIILDLDLCHFAWDRKNYLAASNAIEKEFVYVIGQEKWDAGRKDFLTKLRNRGFIYRTEAMKPYEEEALANIDYSLSMEK